MLASCRAKPSTNERHCALQNQGAMSSPGSPGAALRRGEQRLRSLRAVVRDTQRALADVADVIGAGASQLDATVSAAVHEVGARASRPLVLLVLGRDCGARARLVNSLLGEPVLPAAGARWRWIRLQYGNTRQVKLNLSNTEFEMVVELECNRNPWTVMPEKFRSARREHRCPEDARVMSTKTVERVDEIFYTTDLERSEPSDLSTILDIELNNSFLKDGLKIIIPPDLGSDTQNLNLETFRRKHEEFYTKRMNILKQFTPICFYALNCTGKSIFREHYCDITRRISKDSSKSDEDFWKTHNMYYMTRAPGVLDLENSDRSSDMDCDSVAISDVDVRIKSDNALSMTDINVFSEENCLDLQQVKEINPNLQVYFVLLSDSIPIKPLDQTQTYKSVDQSERLYPSKAESETSDRHKGKLEAEATESTEQVLYKSGELPESDRELNSKKADTVLRREKDAPCNINEDAYALFAEQSAFMNDLVDQWRLMCCGMSKSNSNSHWMILDDAEVALSWNKKPLATLITKAAFNIESASDKQVLGPKREKGRETEVDRARLVATRPVLVARVTKFLAETIHNHLLELCTRMSEIHVNLLQQFILTSFDMAREMQVVPKKIEYVAVHEHQLFYTINEKFSEGEKKEELVQIMQQVLHDMKDDIDTMDWCVDDLPCHREIRVSNSVFYGATTPQREPETNELLQMNSTEPNIPDVEQAISYDSYNFEDYDIVTEEETTSIHSGAFQNTESLSYANCQSMNLSAVMSNVSSQISLIRVENESSINSSVFSKIMNYKPSGAKCTSNTQISIKQASLDVQKTVLTRLSRKISLRLIKFVDCLRDSYFGTLQRCLESLEASCREELGGRPATEAMRQVLLVGRQVDLQACASFSVLRTLVEHLRRLFQRLKVGGSGPGGGACCVLSPVWRRHVALHTLHTLSPSRLARLISAQILEKLSVAHERYQAALAALAAALEARLHHTEVVKLAIRKRYAPGFARLCLESTSMCDVLQYGSPELGREIGRGQYGVVYACKGGWGGHEPCAVKSVLPSDERHYNELAMEFFYTRSIPAHARIVRLWGSAVERHASGSPTVLLVTERKRRDLYCAVRAAQLPFTVRCRISLDIVEGIRYLHSLGLVHRDIKMKNVLLDDEDRASLTDLGFCVPEALMSGSVVGTPVHMAPELLTGDYDSSVDVYAFGILFWYVCAGNIKLPSAFELFQNKEQLWSKVRKGLRPERLPHFTDDCWSVMQSCWASEPAQRALLGDVQPLLERILERSLAAGDAPAHAHVGGAFWDREPSLDLSDDV